MSASFVYRQTGLDGFWAGIGADLFAGLFPGRIMREAVFFLQPLKRV